MTANSAFHGTRLDVQHIGQVMEDLVAQAEARSGIDAPADRARTWFLFRTKPTRRRAAAAPPRRSTLCVASSATAADQIVIANTKGFTGHAMATGIEDVLAVKALETGWFRRWPTSRKSILSWVR